jgi:hypothetical protein
MMDLITAEIKALNNRCEQLEQKNNNLINELKCDSIEFNLLNKLLFFEQKYNKLLNQLIANYEKNLNSENKHSFIKEINEKKVLAKNNGLELNKLRLQLFDWRQHNNRFRLFFIYFCVICFIYYSILVFYFRFQAIITKLEIRPSLRLIVIKIIKKFWRNQKKNQNKLKISSIIR